MTDKVLCPWCGSEMVFTNNWIIYKRGRGKHVGECCYYTCKKCDAQSPHVRVYSGESPLQAALRRYEPPCRPMTRKEVESKYTGIDEGAAVLVEEKFGALWWAILDRLNKKIVATWNGCGAENFHEDTYGKTWRCWPRKPTDEEREACGWEDAE
jgi:hypothetical protein